MLLYCGCVTVWPVFPTSGLVDVLLYCGCVTVWPCGVTDLRPGGCVITVLWMCYRVACVTDLRPGGCVTVLWMCYRVAVWCYRPQAWWMCYNCTVDVLPCGRVVLPTSGLVDVLLYCGCVTVWPCGVTDLRPGGCVITVLWMCYRVACVTDLRPGGCVITVLWMCYRVACVPDLRPGG